MLRLSGATPPTPRLDGTTALQEDLAEEDHPEELPDLKEVAEDPQEELPDLEDPQEDIPDLEEVAEDLQEEAAQEE